MGDKTGIEWTEATWNPVVGCSLTTPGCTNCYAMGEAARLERMGALKYAGLTRIANDRPVWTGEVRLHEAALDQPLRWKRGRRIFVNSMSDLFHEGLTDQDIDRVFAVMALARQHTFQVLTKRAERMRAYMLAFSWERVVESCRGPDGVSVITGHSIADLQRAFGLLPRFDYEADRSAWPLPNVWLGVSVEDQRRADERIPHLLATPAAVRFLSMEPLLGPVDLEYPAGLFQNGPAMCCDGRECGCRGLPVDPPLINGLDWVIVGGESGPKARPMHPDWVRSIRDQCAAAGTAFLFKQWGEWAPGFYEVGIAECYGTGTPDIAWPDGSIAWGAAEEHGGNGTALHRKGKKAAGRELDDRTHDEYPQVAA
ncbi:DUF5131 family protein [Azospirillum sp.]|uniref:DUF5131 family protein n=1 Tax=Azospirillum sp. TaxID=34012 RepID=UPI003D75CF84